MTRTIAAAAIALLCAGCATTSGARWYAPATWFSHAPAAALDKAEKGEDAARHDLIKSAQRNAHSTQAAIAAAPASRPVATAADFAASTVAALDQAAGPLKTGEIDKVNTIVDGLLSENATVRAGAERARASEKSALADISARLDRAQSESEQAGARLRAAFDRENALANELRSQRALIWIVGALAGLCALGWLYAKIAFGGIPNAVGRGLASLRTRDPAAGELATQIFDSLLNRSEQQKIAKAAR